MTSPESAVLVTAYGRRQFIGDAVRSAVQQDVDPARFGIVCITDFPDPRIDELLRGRAALHLQETSGSWADWVRAGLARTTAEVLCFLDDDDLFAPTKLSAAVSIFREHPQLGYYHNRALPRIEPAAPGPPSGESSGASPVGPEEGLVRDREKDPAHAERLFWSRGGFNDSCIAVRRAVLETMVRELPALEVGHSLGLFYTAWLGPWDLYFDRRVLTQYRVHDANSSSPAGRSVADLWRRGPERARATARDSERVARRIEADPRRRASPRPVRSVGRREHLVTELLRAGASRSQILRAAGGYVAASSPSRLADQRGLLGLTALAVLDPGAPTRWVGRLRTASTRPSS